MIKEQIIERIQKLIEKTESNGIIWKFVNANSYSWTSTKEEKAYILSLTKGSGRYPQVGVPSNNLTLTLKGARKEVVFQLSSTYSDKVRELLNTLFEKAREQSARNFVDILEGLIS